MIQIAAAITPAIAATSENASAGGSAPGFLALLAKTMSTQDSGGNAAVSVMALLGGQQGTAGEQAAGVVRSSGKAGSGRLLAESDPTRLQASPDPATLALMQSLAIPALAAGVNNVPVSRLEGGQSGLDVAAVKSGRGQNLPSRLASLAVQDTAAKGQQMAPKDAGTPFLDALSTKPAAGAIGADRQLDSALLAGKPDGQAVVMQQSFQAHLASQQSSIGGTQPAVNAQNVAMQSGFGSAGWQQEFGDKVVWMASGQGHVSDLTLNPPSLGTVEIRLHVNGSEAGAQFYAANADVRNALEAAMPKLREMMANAGIALGEAMVSNQSFSQRESFQSQGQSGSGSASGPDGAAGVDGVDSATGRGMPPSRVSNALLDYYA